jgi:hypothetical protein
VKFGSFLGTDNGTNNLPSPNSYHLNAENYYDRRGGKIAVRLPTEFDISLKRKTPGPANYKLDAITMKGSGSYILSNYHNSGSL